MMSEIFQFCILNKRPQQTSSPSYYCIGKELGADIHNLILSKEMEADRKNKNKREQGKHDIRILLMQNTNKFQHKTKSLYNFTSLTS